MYDLLHAAQREFLPRQKFASCFGQTAQLPANAKFKVREVYDERWDIPATKIKNVPRKAVTIEVVVSYSEGGEDIETVLETSTSHAFDVNGEWRWIVSPEVVREARQGFC